MKVNKEVKFDVYFLCFCFIFFDFVMFLCPPSTGFCRVPAACQPRTDFQCVPRPYTQRTGFYKVPAYRNHRISQSNGAQSVQNLPKYQKPRGVVLRGVSVKYPQFHCLDFKSTEHRQGST